MIEEEVNNNIKLKKVKFGSEMEKLPNVEKPLMDGHFFYILNGKAGSGKTSLLTNFVINSKMYKGKFDKIFVWSPSLCSMEENIFDELPPEQKFDSLIHEEIEDVLEQIKGTGEKILFIFDDVVNELKQVERLMKKIIMNRRHLTNSLDCEQKGFVSIIMTTQAYNLVILSIRKQASLIITFNSTNEKEKQSLYEEYLSGFTKEQFKRVSAFV